MALTLSLLVNFFLLGLLGVGLLLMLIVVVASLGGESSSLPLTEKVYSGKSTADDKVAVIRIEGIILEGALNFAHKQIDNAAEDKNVKAVVVRVNSPGGSITASDDLHRRLTLIRDGNPEKGTEAKKHLVVSMGSVAASGGYYISMPAKTLVAERTTITGSIGVYAALPNIHELADKYGVRMDIIKRGEVKASGSMFKEMTPEDREVWDEMIGDAFGQFLKVVEEGRPDLKGKLREEVVKEKRKGVKIVHNDKGEYEEVPVDFEYVRRRADGGIYTAERALEYGLIDKVGYLEDAIAEAKKAAGLSDDAKVITYERPFSFSEAFSGVQAPDKKVQLDFAKLSSGFTPRVWYLAPGSELAGFLAAAGN